MYSTTQKGGVSLPTNPSVVSSIAAITHHKGRVHLVSDQAIQAEADSLFSHLNGQRVAVLIDGANFHKTARALEFAVDYKKLRDLFIRNSASVELHYFTAVNYNTETLHFRNTITWMMNNGYIVTHKSTKPLKQRGGPCIIKGNMDVELAVEAMSIHQDVDHIVLVTGDGDFSRLVQKLQDCGTRVTVISSDTYPVKRCADELKAVCDVYIDIPQFQQAITNTTPRS